MNMPTISVYLTVREMEETHREAKKDEQLTAINVGVKLAKFGSL
jgi:hypothetical protein